MTGEWGELFLNGEYGELARQLGDMQEVVVVGVDSEGNIHLERESSGDWDCSKYILDKSTIPEVEDEQ